MTLTAMIQKHGDRGAETMAWVWAARMRTAAKLIDAPETLELVDAVEATLAREGVWGMVDMALAGPTLGGLGANDTARLVGVMDERSAQAA